MRLTKFQMRAISQPFFLKEEIFVYLDELDEVDRIRHASLEYRKLYSTVSWLEQLTAKQEIWVRK